MVYRLSPETYTSLLYKRFLHLFNILELHCVINGEYTENFQPNHCWL